MISTPIGKNKYKLQKVISKHSNKFIRGQPIVNWKGIKKVVKTNKKRMYIYKKSVFALRTISGNDPDSNTDTV